MIIKNKISIFFCFTDDSVEIFSFILLCHKERVKKAVSTLQLYGKNEFNQLHNAICCRYCYLFPIRILFSPLLWVCSKLSYRIHSLWESNMVVQMVADKT